ncbi:zinc finger BED domain-containing protein 1-like isoform X2 [Thrips palmi]|uniref:Zinc finger BED domain-containing protein 1-like isoform X2 n=1 Tax=Thrips palmi TaxID=161013 RepID=A0A6P8YPX7_THRPL|nr:zinc finger BED domain-containing protein 1-like isoform X2 [Thrips palmi]
MPMKPRVRVQRGATLETPVKKKVSQRGTMADSSVQNILSRLMEEKHTFTYKKLVVPMSMRSPYWKYYGFPATEDGDILTKVKIVCVLCKAQLAYNKNTSNLRMHLQNRHAKELMELVAEHPPEIRPSHKQQAQVQEEQEISPIRHTSNNSKQQKRTKCHRSLENTDSGFTKQGNVYFTQADGSIEIDGDLQFMSDPNISISNFTQDEETSSTIQIFSPPTAANPNVVLQQGSENNKNISDAIAEFLILDLQRADVVEGRGFQRLIATLRSPCEIPSKGRLVDEILPSMQCHLKESEQEFLQLFTGDYGITIEEWVSNNDESFLTFSVHYQHKTEPSLETRVMSTVHCPNSNGVDLHEYWTVFIDALFSEWHINANKVTAIVIATSCTELIQVLASKNFILVPCLMYSLQECASFLLSLSDVHPVLQKCRALLGLIHRHPTALASLRMQEPELQVDEPVVTDCPAIWMTTYQMLEQLSLRRALFPSVLENVTELSADQRLQLLLSEEEWTVVDDIVAALGPFKVAVLTLSEERFPLLSLLEPLLWQLCSSHLQDKDGDSLLVMKLKQILRDNLAAKYVNEDVRTLLRTSTMLDPRFKTLGYADEDVKEDVYERIQKSLEELYEQNPTSIEFSPTPNKKPRLSGMALLLGGVCETKGSVGLNDKAKLELDQFKSETSAPLDACPLQWWSHGSVKCPNLVHLARRYLTLPAAVMPAHRIPLPQALIFHERRKILAPDEADTLLFLNTNYHG